MRYRAIRTAKELREILGSQCSPMGRDYCYVIGPDVNGRLCHCATTFGYKEAKARADIMNKIIDEGGDPRRVKQ